MQNLERQAALNLEALKALPNLQAALALQNLPAVLNLLPAALSQDFLENLNLLQEVQALVQNLPLEVLNLEASVRLTLPLKAAQAAVHQTQVTAVQLTKAEEPLFQYLYLGADPYQEVLLTTEGAIEQEDLYLVLQDL